ncbi:type II toxin-antitoxin system ParD family antitoxin [Rhizobium calliandrae]|uniref:Type II toxin-antitoxin system ParD family antitoxin n=1 Tax=Rhizobium calliandrae TaxID=1312182 RepID=A0ABT7KQS0_9HYPH|nr:type II toxin-antitoxin system ParD family antitoxin [Rhizobium calliandrae]MDL2410932.1 type II toxin-antitoxin system ParD family antitoxin [Rhizobium calliandrae]
MAGRNFSLTKHLSEFVDNEVSSGRHQTASEVIREALRRYEDDVVAERASIAVLEKVAAEGDAAIERGDYTLIRGPGDSQELLDRLNARAARKSAPTSPRNG